MQIPLKFIANKNPNWDLVQKLLQNCKTTNQWSNFGPVSKNLEEFLHKKLGLASELTVVMTSSGTSALHSLVQMHSYLKGRELTWVTSSFAFPCLSQGPLSNISLVDILPNGMLDVSMIDCEYDGVIVTNIYGSQSKLDDYRDYCHTKILIVDSATAFDYVEHQANEFISFHHTKPWGFGEGGCAIINREHEKLFRAILNFGLQTNISEDIRQWSSNSKISEVAAAFIYDRIQQDDLSLYQQQYQRICNLLPFNHIPSVSTMGYVTFVLDQPCTNINNRLFETKKYYKPLNAFHLEANKLFERVLCVPCFPEMNQFKDSDIKSSILEQLNL